ncbi:MAG: DUF1330 domain-containing protein [Betaproteobacteria bacterium]
MSAPAKSAWVIGHATVKDEAKWALYRQSVAATFVPFAAVLLLRGQVADVLDGTHPHADAVVVAFPDLAAARAWHESAAYQALIPLRKAAADIDLIIVEA